MVIAPGGEIVMVVAAVGKARLVSYCLECFFGWFGWNR